jgi:SecD/SecF fusion protein
MIEKHAIWKWLILAAAIAGSVAVTKIRYGLDLKGGVSFELQIDEEKLRDNLREENKNATDDEIKNLLARAMEGSQARALEVIRNRVDGLGIEEPSIYPGKNNRIVVQLPGTNEELREKARRALQSVAFLEFRMVHENNDRLVSDLFDKGLAPEGYKPTSAGNRPAFKWDASLPAKDRGDAYRRKLSKFQAPVGHEFLLEKEIVDRETVYRPYFVKVRPEVTGERLKTASVDYRQMGQPVVDLEFDSRGAKVFGDVTRDYAPNGFKNPGNKYRQLAIVLDNTLYSAPTIREPILGGKAEISGSFTVQEATFLSNILKAGALPAPVKVAEERFVAPSLGEDSIRSGVRASIYGAIGVVAFMLIFYFWGGLVANVALALNLVLLPLGMIATAGFLGIFSREGTSGGPIQLPVLTLPGIAGIALTIGMAVDANVLIFERIREELRGGKRLWSAIVAGYERAFITILDSNLTTLLTGIVLFVFGSGPIRGFAVTLNAGIIVSMFTAITVTRLIFGVLVQGNVMKDLKMMPMISGTNFDFLGKKKIMVWATVVIIVITWIVMAGKGLRAPESIFGVDFTGGSSLTLSFNAAKRPSVEDIRRTLSDAGLREAHIQYQQASEGGEDRYLQVKTSSESVAGKKSAEVVRDSLTKAFPESGFSVAQDEEVGPQVGSELKKRAVWSLVLSLIIMTAYLAWRFEMGFAIGAIVALVHDVLFTVGIFSLLGRQISLTVVAALLTIVGYSVNDTIVVFDRIREGVKLIRNKTFPEICNICINATLSRTLLTGSASMFAVLMLMLFGGGAINDFALTLFVGFVVGTFSSVYVATPVVLLWHKGKMPDFGGKVVTK